MVWVQIVEKIGDEKNGLYVPIGTGSDQLSKACSSLLEGWGHSGQAPRALPQPSQRVGGVSDKDPLFQPVCLTAQGPLGV